MELEPGPPLIQTCTHYQLSQTQVVYQYTPSSRVDGEKMFWEEYTYRQLTLLGIRLSRLKEPEENTLFLGDIYISAIALYPRREFASSIRDEFPADGNIEVASCIRKSRRRRHELCKRGGEEGGKKGYGGCSFEERHDDDDDDGRKMDEMAMSP